MSPQDFNTIPGPPKRQWPRVHKNCRWRGTWWNDEVIDWIFIQDRDLGRREAEWLVLRQRVQCHQDSVMLVCTRTEAALLLLSCNSLEGTEHHRVLDPEMILMWCEVAQSCPTVCDPMNYSLPHSSVHGIFQARVLEWVSISFSRGSSWPRDQIWVSCIVGRRFTIWAIREEMILEIIFFHFSFTLK